jgi:hypothetical protein
MAKFLQFALRKTNGLTKHTEKLKTFTTIHITVTTKKMHFTEKSGLKLPNYVVYHMNHPAGTAQGGTTIIIKSSIKHHQLNNYSQNFLQVITVSRRLSWSFNNFSWLSSTQIHSNTRTIRRFLQYPWTSAHCRRRLQCKAYQLTNWESILITPKRR